MKTKLNLICALCGRWACQEDHARMLSKFPLFIEAREVLESIMDLPADDYGERIIPAGFLDSARALLAKMDS